MASVLFVDDDAAVLDGLRRYLRLHLPEVAVRLATGGDEACAVLRGEAVDVVVTDLHMPGANGSQVLTTARAASPRTARLVLSGWVDETDTLRSLPFAHRYFRKPVQPARLAATLRLLVDAAANVPADRLRGRVGRVVALPSRPGTLAALRRALAGPAPDAAVAAVAEADLAIGLSILHVAACAAGDAGPPASVADAVRALGTEPLRHLLQQTSLFDERWPATGWAAVVAEVLADLALPQAGEAPAAGAVGLLTLAACAPDAMRRALASAGPGWDSLVRALRATFACSHEQLGSYVLGLWGVPPADAPQRTGDGPALALAELAALARATTVQAPPVPPVEPAVATPAARG